MALQTVTAEIEVTATLEAKGEIDHYVVPGSPVWTTYTPITWGDFTVGIAGVTVKLSELPDVLKDAIWNYVVEEIDDNKWSEQE